MSKPVTFRAAYVPPGAHEASLVRIVRRQAQLVHVLRRGGATRVELLDRAPRHPAMGREPSARRHSGWTMKRGADR